MQRRTSKQHPCTRKNSDCVLSSDDILGENIGIVSELAVVVVVPPNAQRKQNVVPSTKATSEYARMVRNILLQMIPSSAPLKKWRIPIDDVADECGEGLLKGELVEQNEGESSRIEAQKPSLEEMAAHHAAMLVLNYAIVSSEKILSNPTFEVAFSQALSRMVESFRMLRADLFRDETQKECLLALDEWRTSHRMNMGQSGMYSTNALDEQQRNSLPPRGRSIYEVVSTEIEYLRAIELLDEFFVQVYFVSRGANKRQDEEAISGSRQGLHERTKSMARWRLKRKNTMMFDSGNSTKLASVVYVCKQCPN